MSYLLDSTPRQRQLFSFGWQFRIGDLEETQARSAGPEDFRPVQLPHDWSVEYPFDETAVTCGSGGYVRAGIGWYKKIFTVSSGTKGKLISLQFDGAYMRSKVWLNGKLLGQHIYGYTPFTYDITDVLDYTGENTVTVKIDNSAQPNSRWYTGSGIVRDVWLIAVEPTHIA